MTAFGSVSASTMLKTLSQTFALRIWGQRWPTRVWASRLSWISMTAVCVWILPLRSTTSCTLTIAASFSSLLWLHLLLLMQVFHQVFRLGSRAASLKRFQCARLGSRAATKLNLQACSLEQPLNPVSYLTRQLWGLWTSSCSWFKVFWSEQLNPRVHGLTEGLAWHHTQLQHICTCRPVSSYGQRRGLRPGTSACRTNFRLLYCLRVVS